MLLDEPEPIHEIGIAGLVRGLCDMLNDEWGVDRDEMGSSKRRANGQVKIGSSAEAVSSRRGGVERPFLPWRPRFRPCPSSAHHP